MNKPSRRSIKTKAGKLQIEASAPGYYNAQRSVRVTGRTHVTLRLYPRRDPQQPTRPDRINPLIWQPEPIFKPAPTLIVGLGGTGRYVLTHVKKNLLDIGFGTMPAQVRLAVIDTPDRRVSIGGVSLTDEETLELGADLKPLVKRLCQDHDPDLSDWFPAAEYARLSDDELNLASGSRQRRPLSRAMIIEDLRQGIFNEGIDILLLIDCSPSMEERAGREGRELTRLQAAQQAALSFVSQIDRLADQVGVIAFGAESQELVSLSRPSEQIVQAIQSIVIRNGTDIACALQLASDIFTRNSVDHRTKVALLLSDGESEAEPAIAAAKRLKDQGVHLITIGIGDVGQELLAQLASQWQGQPDTFYAADADALRDIYLRLARRIGRGSRVWRLLRSIASSVIYGEHFRVILVTSLAGGFGGAILADVAYLLRLIGQNTGVKNISIEAYLADASIFEHVAAERYQVLQANAFAAMREIERFQLAQGFPFRMAYDSRRGDDPVLNGIINWRLLDNIYLFNCLPKVGSGDPQLSVFPMIADAICFALDEQAHTNAWRNYRRNVQGLVTTEQWACGRAVIGSIGVARYVFPIRDVLDILRARWATRLITYLLVGDTDPTLKLKPEQNREESADRLDQHVRLFLLGYAGYDHISCPSALSMVGRVLSEGPEILQGSEAASRSDKTAEDVRNFQKYLYYALEVMLNGWSIDWLKARTGKMGYVLAFLSRLEEDLNHAIATLSQTNLATFVKGCLDVTRQVRQQLCDITAKIRPDLIENVDQIMQTSLISELQAFERAATERLKMHERIPTHTLLLKTTEIEELLTKMLNAPDWIKEGLSRFYWVLDPDRGPMLKLLVNEGQEVKLTENLETVQRFSTTLLHLADQASQELLATVQSLLSERIGRDPENTAQSAWNVSKPLLAFDDSLAQQVSPALVLAVNRNVDQLEALLHQRLPAARQFYRLQTSDPYHLLVLQTIDVVPVHALTTWEANQNVYHRWYGLTETGQGDRYAEPTAVFRAEAISLRWEAALLKELRQKPRLFSPLLVTGLETHTRVRLFALAFASGWVEIRDRTMRIRNITIDLPDLSNFSRRPSPYVVGMVSFACQAEPSQVQDIEQALQTVNPEIWRQWTKPDWRQSESVAEILGTGLAEAEDFVTYTALVVRDEFRNRMLKRS